MDPVERIHNTRDSLWHVGPSPDLRSKRAAARGHRAPLHYEVVGQFEINNLIRLTVYRANMQAIFHSRSTIVPGGFGAHFDGPDCDATTSPRPIFPV